ncbi:MAG: magnesium transporter [Nitrosomonadales bacterium]|mgnify:FL=1|jgi:magnesium transporter|nr:magnesium transporter [Nitrosomonadales bacterium]MBT4571556.1 magnesium transporter [Nitrosomonadales bacterium]MBT4759847.1 magnesium transporter [Nitrosomonadales bacterium]MBT5149898.1 magnesium transporter [Nitrosomonadales bacterium]MBT5572968.1 magnesium transporter [Nitrosomonadales bacterium]
MKNNIERKESLNELIEQINALLESAGFSENSFNSQPDENHTLIKNLVSKKNISSLERLLDDLHPADIADILESLPVQKRLVLWDLVKSKSEGDILIEVSDAVRQTLIADMDSTELLAAAEQLETDEIADIAPDLPEEVLQDLLENLDIQNRERLQSALSYPEDSVGSLMEFEVITIREDVTLEVVLNYLRKIEKLPNHTDKLFVVDRDGLILGVLPLERIIVNPPTTKVKNVMAKEIVLFKPEDLADEASNAFERYDLVTAPVVDKKNKLVGRLTVEAVMDFIRQESDNEKFSMAGLREEEDIFASIWKSVQNRWAWLAINLLTAFIASRVIGIFEGSIEKVVALAALMPIIASIGGNSGNQTTAMIVRALAIGQLTQSSIRSLLYKEISVALLNGLIWGSIVGLFAFYLYNNANLGYVMAGAMVLNLMLAAIMGVLMPILMYRLGKDPAVGSSVLITAMTDSGGFFIFLGLATLVLI